MTTIVPAMTVTSRAGSELISELRERGALTYRSATPVQGVRLGAQYILDQLLTIGVVREGPAAGTYYLDEETLGSFQRQGRQIRLIGIVFACVVFAALLVAIFEFAIG